VIYELASEFSVYFTNRNFVRRGWFPDRLRNYERRLPCIEFEQD
jgi:hypothetical protein